MNDADTRDWQDGPLVVVINDEEQYSIWPADRAIPAGWHEVGVSGDKAHCLAHIAAVWTDMRPRSYRERLAARPAEPSASPTGEPPASVPAADPRDDLVGFLSRGPHPVELVIRPALTAERLIAALADGFILLKFTDTRGGTELGVDLDPARCRYSEAEIQAGTGTVQLHGTLSLDETDVSCTADLALPLCRGQGQLHLGLTAAPNTF